MRKETDSCPVAVLRRSSGRHRFPSAWRLVAAGHSLAATDRRAHAGEGSTAGVRHGVRRISRVPQRASPTPPRGQLLHRNVTMEVV